MKISKKFTDQILSLVNEVEKNNSDIEIKKDLDNIKADLLGDEYDKSVDEEDVDGEDEVTKITAPFDPTMIDVDIETINLGLLIEDIKDGIIDLQPDFQRASDVWDIVKKSRLIESILLGLPLPSFYFSEDPKTKKFAVIDGLQRICAIRDFVIDGKLKLKGLQFLKSFEGLTYSKLEQPERRRINTLKITKNTLRKSTPIEVKYVIFQRVNTAGVPLEPQEMRHALNQGRAAIFIKELAEIDSFTTATNGSVKTKRMQDRDFANRFVAFYLDYKNYNGELDVFLSEKMGELNSMSENELYDIKRTFDKSLKCCYNIFRGDTFRRRNNIRDRRKPISKAVYDTLSVNIAWLSDSERQVLEQKSELVKEKIIELFNEDKFHRAISTGTGQKYSVDLRFKKVKEMLSKILGYDKED